MHKIARETHPIIVGVGQTTHFEKVDAKTLTALDLMKNAVAACVADTGRSDMLTHLDSISMVNSFSLNGGTPVEALCHKIGVRPDIREETAIGGNNPQWLVNRAADLIASGKIRAAMLVGGELFYRKKQAEPIFDMERTLERMKTDPQIVGDCRVGYTFHEELHQAYTARNVYPLFENALRYHLGMSLSEHRAFLRGYFKGMAAVAANTPYAWFQKGKSIGDITRVRADNRMIAFPYTKFMNPNPMVNQAAALIMTDTHTARRLGIPTNKWVYLHGGAEATDKWFVSDRVNYHSSPAIREIARASLQMTGVGLGDIDFFDLYSCFPCAALIAALSIGLTVENLPSPTITGGLPYFGGPGNNYTMHAIAHTVERLRNYPTQFGLVTGMGWFLTKHAAGVYSGVAPQTPWKRSAGRSLQEKIDAVASPKMCAAPSGAATVETYTVIHDQSAPMGLFPVVVARLDSGERCLATTASDPSVMMAMEQEEFVGKKGVMTPGNNAPNIINF